MVWLMLITLLTDRNTGTCQMNGIIGGSLIWGDVPERDAKPKEITVGKMCNIIHAQAHKGTDKVCWTLMNIPISSKTVLGVPNCNCLMCFVSFYTHLYYIWVTFVEMHIGVSIQKNYIGNIYMKYVFVGWSDWSAGLRVIFFPNQDVVYVNRMDAVDIWTASIKPRLLFLVQAMLPKGFPFHQFNKIRNAILHKKLPLYIFITVCIIVHWCLYYTCIL